MALLNFDTIQEIEELGEEEGMEFVGECFEIYQTDALQLIRSMESAFRQRDAAAIRQAAHSLKSSSGNLGAEKMEALCADLENMDASACFDVIALKVQCLSEVYEETVLEMKRILTVGEAEAPAR